MILPTNRLILWVALVGLPASLATVGGNAAGALGWLVIGVLAALAALDAALSLNALDGVGARLPEVLRLSKDRAAELEVTIDNASRRRRAVRVGLSFPAEIEPEFHEHEILLPAGAESSKALWPCTPRRRGRFELTRCRLESPSWLGFWALRKSASVKAELRVYPNLHSERRNAAAVFLPRGAFGIHVHSQVGKGREFEKLREYLPGDSYEDIHWKATAKRGYPITKMYQIERTQEIYVIIDASRLSARRQPGRENAGQSDAIILERFVNAALILGMAAEQQGDLFGLLAFSDRIQRFVRAKSGKTHYDACRDALYTLQAQPVTPDFDEVCAFIRLRLRKRALLVFLTALDDPVLAESFSRNLDLISGQHLILVNMARPDWARPLFEGRPAESLDDIYERLGGHVLWWKLRELEKGLKRHGVQFSLLDNEKLTAELVTQYLSVKRRQLI